VTTSQTDETALSPLDRAALELAIEVTRKESSARRKQVDDFLATREWGYVARFCASCAQSRALTKGGIKPWEIDYNKPTAPASTRLFSALPVTMIPYKFRVFAVPKIR
jgi:hypothetical protein